MCIRDSPCPCPCPCPCPPLAPCQAANRSEGEGTAVSATRRHGETTDRGPASAHLHSSSPDPPPYVPGGQEEQFLEPCWGLKVPGGQGEQEGEPGEGEKEPAGQGRQTDMEEVRKLPGGHREQLRCHVIR
eukprot:660419-Hanusia_phi.AAC.1